MSYNTYNPKTLKDAILRRLGAPVINVEVTEDQIYDCIQRALELNGITEQMRKERGRETSRKRVAKIDLITNEILEVYASVGEAEKVNGQTRHIGDVCNGKRKSCKGFGWKFLES